MSQAPTPSMVYDIIEASSKPGCPLCRVSKRWGERFMAAILYEEVTDPHTRGRLKDSFGFCREHAWQAADVRGALLGMSIIYCSLLNRIDEALERAAPHAQAKWWQKFGSRSDDEGAGAIPGLAAKTECPACLQLRDLERTALVALTDALPADTRLRDGLSGPNKGFCLPHLRQALAVTRTPEAAAFLQKSTCARLDALGAELEEFIRKYDHRFHKEEWGAERDSWQRAIAWVAGGAIPENRGPASDD